MSPNPKIAPTPTTRRPSKASHALEELIGALEGHLGRPPSKSIHLGHPRASHRDELEAHRRHPSRSPSKTPSQKSKEFYAYGALNLSGTQTSSFELSPLDETAEITRIDQWQPKTPSRSSK